MSRTYKEEYLAYGFTLLLKGDTQLPKCVLCGKALANESMKPKKLKAHLRSQHKDQKDKPLEFFKRKERQAEKSNSILQAAIYPSRSLVKASYLVAEKVAKEKKPFTIAEELILPCAKAMCREILGAASADKLRDIPLSARTIKRRIMDMGEDIAEQLYENLSSEEFVIQLDESTDVSKKALLLMFIRYKHGDDFVEDLLSCDELETKTTAAEIFAVVDKHIAQRGLLWQNCIGICTDGAAAMTGHRSGTVKLIQDVAPNARWTHCFLHREALAAKDMSAALSEAMNVAVKVINATRKSAMNCRLFSKLCNEDEAEHDCLLYFAAVRWLSRGNALARLYELRTQILTFLTESGNAHADKFSDSLFLATLAYMADIFSLLNELNTSFQGKTSEQAKNILIMHDKIAAFKSKLDLWTGRAAQGEFDVFENLNELLTGKPELIERVKVIVLEHLRKLRAKFDEYFPLDPRESHAWIRDPFVVDVDTCEMSMRLKTQLIELANDGSLQTSFKHHTLAKFWIEAAQEYPELGQAAIRFLMPFSTTWMCEAGFSVVTYLKSRYRSKLDTATLCANLRIALSPIRVRIDALVRKVQQQKSH